MKTMYCNRQSVKGYKWGYMVYIHTLSFILFYWVRCSKGKMWQQNVSTFNNKNDDIRFLNKILWMEDKTKHINTTKEWSWWQVMPECATSLEDDSLIDSVLAEQLSSDTPSHLRCGETQAPYCVDNEILVICAPNKVLVGTANCSAQHWTKVSPDDITLTHWA
jgi:hypothetical protein